MKYYEKAIENYAKARKKFHNWELKREIVEFNEKIERMTADGLCPRVECKHCPITLLKNQNACGAISSSERREIIAMEEEASK